MTEESDQVGSPAQGKHLQDQEEERRAAEREVQAKHDAEEAARVAQQKREAAEQAAVAEREAVEERSRRKAATEQQVVDVARLEQERARDAPRREEERKPPMPKFVSSQCSDNHSTYTSFRRPDNASGSGGSKSKGRLVNSSAAIALMLRYDRCKPSRQGENQDMARPYWTVPS